MSKKRLLMPFFIFALLFNFLPITCLAAQTDNVLPAANIPAPQIISLENRETQLITRPLITGQSQAGTEVMVYIDGTYAGEASVQQLNANTESFTFRSNKELLRGYHTVFAIAKDPTSLRLSPPSLEVSLYVVPLPAPTLIQPNEQTVTSNVKHLITGLTLSGTRVHVYIDGIHNGVTNNLWHKSGTANFAYRPFLNLSVGEHTLWAVAEDSSGRMSGKSNILHFKIENPYPAPTLLSKKKSNDSLVLGLAKNNSKVKVFVDKKLDGEFKVVNNESGTANFAYRIKQKLSPAKHLIFATAVDNRGKESSWSNFIYVGGERELKPSISEKAAEEGTGAKTSASKEITVLPTGRLDDLIVLAQIYANNKDVKVRDNDLVDTETAINNKDALGINNSDLKLLQDLLAGKKQEDVREEENKQAAEPSETEKNKEAAEIDNLLKQIQATGTEKTGLINESKESQSKLKLNLIIFIGFLLAVIVWIFWVNRELIKERREQNTDSGTKTEDNNK